MRDPTSLQQASKRRDWLRRLDRFAADMNVVLVLFAIGLATLDVTFVMAQGVVNHLTPLQPIVTIDKQADAIDADAR